MAQDIKQAPAVRDAASLIIVKPSGPGDGPRQILMGKRRADAVFLPNKFVFPGGRFDAEDESIAVAKGLSSLDRQRLMQSVSAASTSEAMSALALTAIRETFEETGFIIGEPAGSNANSSPPVPGSSWLNFFAHGFTPAVHKLRFFARAITPPGRPRRFDTRFFLTEYSAISSKPSDGDGELSGLVWLTLDEANSHDTASITKHILKDLEYYFSLKMTDQDRASVPFYYEQDGVQRRVLLSHQVDLT